MPGSEGIRDRDPEVRPVEREVVVPAVPDDHVRLRLRAGEDLAVVDAGVQDHPALHRCLVLLALLNGRIRSIDVCQGREALHAHRFEVSVRHRVSDERDP